MQQPGMSSAPLYRKRRRKRWPLVVGVIAVLGGAYYLLHHGHGGDKDKKRPQAPVTLTTPVHKDVPVYLTGLGTVQAYNTVTVHSQVDGQLMAVKFREGQNVKAGDVLAQIDPRTFQAQYDQAVATKAKDEAQLANTKVDLNRYIKLGNTVSRQTLDTQRATVKQLEATVQADEAAMHNTGTQLSYTTITAPLSGRVGIRQVDQGNIVHPGDANGLVVITQLTPISVIFSLPQQNLDAVNSQLAQHALEVDALAADAKTVVDKGTLALVDNQIDQTTGTVKLKATLPNASYQLWPGAFTNVRLLLTTRPGAMTIPTVAVQHGPQGAYVFVYHADTTAVSTQPVTVGMTIDQDSVIDSGLEDSMQVVTDGMAKLQDGSKVTVAEPKAATGDAAAPPAAADAPTDSPKGKKHHKKEN